MLKSLIPGYNGASLREIKQTYSIVKEIIDGLDDQSLEELFSGNEKDIEEILDILVVETWRALFSQANKVDEAQFGYLEKLTKHIDLQLRYWIFNYFLITSLPSFEINWHHLEWGNLIQIYPKLAIIAARDHSKSWTFSKAYPIWRMFRYHKNSSLKKIPKPFLLSKYGIILSNEYSLVKDFLTDIREEIEGNLFLREHLYPENSTGWGKDEIRSKNGARIAIKSFQSALRGRHPDWMVGDDLLNETVLYSKENRDKVESFFFSVLMNMLVPNGQIIVVGTPFHKKDLYSKLKSTPGWKVLEYPAIFPDGTLLWESRYGLESLLEKREQQGSISFSREILVKPISSDSTIFPYKILERSFLGMEKFSLVSNYYSHSILFVKKVIGCDFAISSNVGSDFTVFITLGLDEFGKYWLLNLWRKKGASYNEQISKLAQLDLDFQPNLIMAEDNAFQKVMVDLAKDRGLNVIGHTTGINKFSFKSGLPALSVLFEQGKIRLPRGDKFSINQTDILVGELSSITWKESGKLESIADHDDTGMALWLAVRGIHYVHEDFDFSFI